MACCRTVAMDLLSIASLLGIVGALILVCNLPEQLRGGGLLYKVHMPDVHVPCAPGQAQRASERGAEADILAAEAALSRAQEELASATRDRDALLASFSQARCTPHL